MNQFVGNMDNLLKAIPISFPPNVAELVKTNVAQTRSAYEQAKQTAVSLSGVAEKVVERQQALTKEFSTQIFEMVQSNMSSALETAEQISKARSVDEILRLQMAFAQSQTRKGLEQINQSAELLAEIGSQTIENWASALAFKSTKGV